MMASYLAGTGGHVPDSIKHLLPDMQQYWFAAAHSEGNHCFLQHLAFLLKDAILVEEKKKLSDIHSVFYVVILVASL